MNELLILICDDRTSYEEAVLWSRAKAWLKSPVREKDIEIVDEEIDVCWSANGRRIWGVAYSVIFSVPEDMVVFKLMFPEMIINTNNLDDISDLDDICDECK